MEQCRLSLVLTGAFQHPLGDLTPIESRTSELLDTVDLCHRQMLVIDKPQLIPYGSLADPLYVLIWNVAGVGLQTLPTEEQQAEIAAKVLQVGLCADGQPLLIPGAWQDLPPPPPCSGHSPCVVLRPSRSSLAIVQPANPGVSIPVRVLIVPRSA